MTRCRSDNHAPDSTLSLDFSGGRANIKDQLREYKYRGIGLSSMSMLDFVLNTYEGQMLEDSYAGQKRKLDGTRAPGRPPNERHEYLAAANKGKSCRVVRNPGHETMPKICGSWFPRSDRTSEQDLHSATMLALLVPWRNLNELKGEDESFNTRYRRMLDSIDDKGRTFITNAQYYHECLDGAKEKEPSDSSNGGGIDLMEECVRLGLKGLTEDDNHPITEADVDLARITRMKARERLYGEAAIDTAIEYKIFSEDTTDRRTSALAKPASEIEMRRIESWEKQLAEHNKLLSSSNGTSNSNPVDVGVAETSIAQSVAPTTMVEAVEQVGNSEGSMSGPDMVSKRNNGFRYKLAMLNTDQRRAHDIIEERLQQHMRGESFSNLHIITTNLIGRLL